MKTVMIVAGLSLISLAGLFAGCQIVQDVMTPAVVSSDIPAYAFDSNEPMKKANGIFFSKMDLDNLIFKMEMTHNIRIAELEYAITKDNYVYAALAKKGVAYQKQAQDTAAQLFGSTGIITALLGIFGGSLLTGAGVSYKMGQTITSLKSTLWSNPEVAIETAVRIRSACLACGVTDEDKIRSIVESEVAKAIAEV